jgi:flagellar biosynthesis chaperone FliJ
LEFGLEKRKLKSLEKVEEILLEEEKEVKEKIAELRNQIAVLQEELGRIDRERDYWTKKLEDSTFTVDELTEILDYMSQLSLKAQEVLNKKLLIEEEEENLKRILSNKIRMKISINSVKNRLENRMLSEEIAKETRELDEYTRVKGGLRRF